MLSDETDKARIKACDFGEPIEVCGWVGGSGWMVVEASLVCWAIWACNLGG